MRKISETPFLVFPLQTGNGANNERPAPRTQIQFSKCYAKHHLQTYYCLVMPMLLRISSPPLIANFFECLIE